MVSDKSAAGEEVSVNAPRARKVAAANPPMQAVEVFETYTFARSERAAWPSVLQQLKSLVAGAEIKVVDIKRDGDELMVTFRRRCTS
ncbi:hypothetical protein JI721_00835 [Alicyclobacillus cycloheptanicus]|jgi:hypothetical protein|uniref:Uncharacterized protein n=1 Tax=Alicyclobacillus cycloheptanicus TaxID=1457 RepID=A0ABT9XKN0_9BACL|nr:hypothetical protein [Alicyclobacillus cycloheptanicus]MDQ0190830.1 hypothetical protein [Alicyclobacillus cycloheptanicus]WDM01470.1 hypothetical protein JI721_00835 [Alicyclobacillus cycloheptanicus]